MLNFSRKKKKNTCLHVYDHDKQVIHMHMATDICKIQLCGTISLIKKPTFKSTTEIALILH